MPVRSYYRAGSILPRTASAFGVVADEVLEIFDLVAECVVDRLRIEPARVFHRLKHFPRPAPYFPRLGAIRATRWQPLSARRMQFCRVAALPT
jgi:hypothetical protein